MGQDRHRPVDDPAPPLDRNLPAGNAGAGAAAPVLEEPAPPIPAAPAGGQPQPPDNPPVINHHDPMEPFGFFSVHQRVAVSISIQLWRTILYFAISWVMAMTDFQR